MALTRIHYLKQWHFLCRIQIHENNLVANIRKMPVKCFLTCPSCCLLLLIWPFISIFGPLEVHPFPFFLPFLTNSYKKGKKRVKTFTPCHDISSLFHPPKDSPFVSFDRFFHMLFPTYLIMCSYHFVPFRTSFSRCSASHSVDNLMVCPLQSPSVAFLPHSLRFVFSHIFMLKFLSDM